MKHIHWFRRYRKDTILYLHRRCRCGEVRSTPRVFVIDRPLETYFADLSPVLATQPQNTYSEFSKEGK